MVKQRQVYSAESQVLRFRHVLLSMVEGAYRSRYMGYRLFIKDVRAEYSRSAFGMVWDFLDPLVLGAIFFFLVQARIINAGELTMPYSIFVLYGMLLYQTFADAAVTSVEILPRSRGILSHLKIPPEALLLSVAYRQLFYGAFRIIVLLGFSLAIHPAATDAGLSAFSLTGFGMFLLLFPALILTGMAIGVFLAPFNAIYGDVGRVLRLALQPLRYAMPVLYVLPDVFPLNWVDSVNPISLILVDLRLVATSGVMLDPLGFAWRCAFFGAVFCVGWLIFHLSIPVLAERA